MGGAHHSSFTNGSRGILILKRFLPDLRHCAHLRQWSGLGIGETPDSQIFVKRTVRTPLSRLAPLHRAAFLVRAAWEKAGARGKDLGSRGLRVWIGSRAEVPRDFQ